MKQFSLEEYLKNPERKVVTRTGRPVRIICTDAKDDNYPVVALITLGDKEIIRTFSDEGIYCISRGDTSHFDLFFAPQTHKCWSFSCVAPTRDTAAMVAYPLYATREEAEANAGDKCIIEITWEE